VPLPDQAMISSSRGLAGRAPPCTNFIEPEISAESGSTTSWRGRPLRFVVRRIPSKRSLACRSIGFCRIHWVAPVIVGVLSASWREPVRKPGQYAVAFFDGRIEHGIPGAGVYFSMSFMKSRAGFSARCRGKRASMRRRCPCVPEWISEPAQGFRSLLTITCVTLTAGRSNGFFVH